MLQTSSKNNHDTSAHALAGIGMANLSGELKKIHDIVMAAARHGIDDMSGREIQAQYERVHGKRIDSGTVSARVAGLVAANRLERCRIARACRVTGKDIHPVRVVAQQSRLAA